VVEAENDHNSRYVAASLSDVEDADLEEGAGVADATPVDKTEGTCKDQALAKILKMFEDPKSKVLVEQFQLTALKTALYLKGMDPKSTQSLESVLKSKQEALQKEEISQESVRLYQEFGLQADALNMQPFVDRIKKKQVSYFDMDARLKNDEMGKMYLLLKEQPSSMFKLEDAAIAWVYKKVQNAKGVKKGTPSFNTLSLSTQVNKMLDPKIAGGSNMPKEKVEKLIADKELIIGKELKKTLSSLSEECKVELGLLDVESCSPGDATHQMMKDIFNMALINLQESGMKAYYTDVKGFLKD
jgi:hypothetical protein